MKILPSICIDLGAAFTKIAIRKNPNDTSILLGDPGQVGDYQICVPSLALHRASTDSWLFGWEILNLDPKTYSDSEDIKIYQNWKSRLFQTSSDATEVSLALDCCREFLNSLGQELIPLMISLHRQFKSLSIADFDTQICVPDFVLGTRDQELMEHMMVAAGFKNRGSYCISEPKSSLIGVLTEGQNYINDDRTPNLTYMFREFDLLQKLTSHGEYIFFLDIGAFTTDLALTNLETKTKAQILSAPTASYPLGIFKLDEMVMEALGQEFTQLIRTSEASFRENFHRIVYSSGEGEEIILRDGTELDNVVIGKVLDQFAASIIQAVSEFLAVHKKGNIEISVLTGGGTLCSRISSRVAEGLTKFHINVIRAHESANVKNLDPISSEIVRGSSAIGGTSVLYAFK